jgi:hypothetical protein
MKQSPYFGPYPLSKFRKETRRFGSTAGFQNVVFFKHLDDKQVQNKQAVSKVFAFRPDSRLYLTHMFMVFLSSSRQMQGQQYLIRLPSGSFQIYSTLHILSLEAIREVTTIVKI